MNRRNRHLLVVLIAVVTAGLASFGVYRAVTRIPVREVEVARTFRGRRDAARCRRVFVVANRRPSGRLAGEQSRCLEASRRSRPS